MVLFRRLIAILATLACLGAPAAATVNSSANKTIALGNNVQTVFTFSFIGVASTYIAVIYTDASGNETVLTQGTGTTQYQIALNAPVQGAIWGLGGTITYNPSGTPIATGTTLTIYRTLPLTQAISLQNQSSVQILGQGAETGLDTGVMQGQQIAEQIGRAIVANITNQAPPNPLPPAAQAAGMGLCFDSSGDNVIACSLTPSGIISSAMAPVVSAASLAAGRAAFGLGSMAVENINGGSCGGASIQDDGSGGGTNGVGYARVVPATVADSTNRSVTCAFHLTNRMLGATATYTLAAANANLFNGFSFTINAYGGTATVTPNAADNFQGVASGTAVVVPQGSVCQITTNAAPSATWWIDCHASQAQLTANVAASALTISLNATQQLFRSTTLASGVLVPATPTGLLAITVPSGATLGTSSSNVPFRIWIFLAYNSGTPVLGVATCSSAGTIYSCKAWEFTQQTGTAITAGATALGTLYTASGVTNDAIRIIGYAEYATGLSTAGAWASAPTTLQLCIDPMACPRPGDIVQTVTATTTTVGTVTSTSFVALTNGPSLAITPSSAANLVRVYGAGNISNSTTGITAYLQFARGVTLIGNPASSQNATVSTPLSLLVYDRPGVATATTYTVYGKTSGGTTSYPFTSTGSIIELQEIMGALEPANDNGAQPLRMVG